MNKSLRRVLAMSRKEFIQITRDPSSFLIAFVLPLMLLIIYGKGLSLDAHNLKIGIAIENNESNAQSLADSFRFSPYFITKIKQHRREFYSDLSAGKLDGILTIPFDFNRRLNNPHDRASVQLITDGSDPNTATFVRNYTQATVDNWLQIRRKEEGKWSTPGIKTVPRVWFNEELNSHDFLIPGSMVIIITLTGTLLTSLVIAKEWEIGTMEAVMATPISMKEILMSKFLSYFLLGVGTLLTLYVLARFVFGVPFRGSLFVLLLVSFAYLSVTLGMGILISTLTKNQFAATQAAIVVSFLPAFMLSGFLFEIASMPLPIQWLSSLLPPRYYVQSLQTLFLAGDVYSILVSNTLILLTFTLLVFVLFMRKTRKRLD